MAEPISRFHEETGSPAQLRRACPSCSTTAPVKAPFSSPNSSLSSKASGIAAQIDSDKRLIKSQAVGVNRAGHKFLACSTFAANEHRRIAPKYSLNELTETFHRPALPDEGAVGFSFCLEALVLCFQRVQLGAGSPG